MTKYKVGDRVRYVTKNPSADHRSIKVGKVYTIQEVIGTSYRLHHSCSTWVRAVHIVLDMHPALALLEKLEVEVEILYSEKKIICKFPNSTIFEYYNDGDGNIKTDEAVEDEYQICPIDFLPTYAAILSLLSSLESNGWKDIL